MYDGMILHLYNTLDRKKVQFVPLDDRDVRMYVCGPTVYDKIHIGNARPIVVFDVLYRLLKLLYPKVTYVRNITDVDDKIMLRAAESKEDINVLTKRTIEQFERDVESLGALEPDIEPRATEHIEDMIKIIDSLIANGSAYVVEGHVLFHVSSISNYGVLSGRDRDEMIAGARIEVAPYKKDPADFVLWKPSTEMQVGWTSPWGRGRPGWHIECSAMSTKYLGPNFDIHGGGEDLIFPHHENEIAQSQSAISGSSFAKFWLHNGYLRSEGKKMSKSEGNFYTVDELLGVGERERMWRGESMRLMMLSTHYRQPIDFTKRGLDIAKRKLDRWYRCLGETDFDCAADRSDVVNVLCDDINTPKAIAAMDSLCRQVLAGGGLAQDAKHEMLAGASLLGLLRHNTEAWFQGTVLSDLDEEVARIDALIEERDTARKNREFNLADTIRQELLDVGVILEDKPDGKTIWRRDE